MLSNTAIPLEYGKFRESVLRGEIPVNEEISLEMNRIDFLISCPDYYYDDEALDGFVNFCENEMTLTDGSDLQMLPSFKLWAESCLSWFYFVTEKVYNPAIRMYETKIKKKRLVNKQYLIVGRGGAKSLYASYIQQYHNVIDTETTHQIVVAPTMKQAEEVMQPIRTAMARKKGPLFKFLCEGNIFSQTDSKPKLASTKKGIENFITNSFIEVRTLSIDKLQGLRVKVATLDEWLSGKLKEDPITAIEQGASKVDDYLIIAISSEGTQRNGVGDSIKMELNSILRGDYFNPSVSIWHYKLDSVEEIKYPELWVKANPNIGATISYSEYEKEVVTAENVPHKRNEILAKRFGIPTEGLSYFFKYEDTLPHPKFEVRGLPCSMGCDLSQGDDFCAFTFLFPLRDGGFAVKCRSYVTRVKMKKLTAAAYNKYQDFIKEDTLVVMEDYMLKMEDVYDDLVNFIFENQYAVLCVGYDRYNSEYFINRWGLEFGTHYLTKVIQGMKTETVPLGEINNAAHTRNLIFDEEIMKFCMGNSMVLEDVNGNMMLSKKRSSDKIDNVAALMDAWVAISKFKEVFGFEI